MKKLFLSSRGLVPEIRKNFLEFLVNDPSRVKVAFIATAAGPDGALKPYIKEAIDQIKYEGMEVVEVDLKAENDSSLLHKLSGCDVIWMNGGNSFYLMYWIRKSGFDKIIDQLLDNGKIYFGVSAGSYVACPTIEAASWKHADSDIVGLKDLTGLSLVPFLIGAHFDREKYHQCVIEGVKKTKLPVVALYDTQAINIKLLVLVQKNFLMDSRRINEYFSLFQQA